METILHLDEVMEAGKLSYPTVYKLATNRTIKTFKIGVSALQLKNFLNDYINKQIMEAENERNK